MFEHLSNQSETEQAIREQHLANLKQFQASTVYTYIKAAAVAIISIAALIASLSL